MSKIIFLSLRKRFDTNQGMLTLLKVMYYLGYLPFSWFNENDTEYFEISNWKTFFMLLFDFLLILLIPANYYFWHLYNLGKDFDMSLLLQPSYYVKMNDGVFTTAISQLIFVAWVGLIFWAFAYIGNIIPLLVIKVPNFSSEHNANERLTHLLPL